MSSTNALKMVQLRPPNRAGPWCTESGSAHRPAKEGLSDHHGEGAALNNLGSALAEVGRFEEAITSHHQAAHIDHKLGDHHGEGRALGNLGLALIQLRRLSDARDALEQAAALFVTLRAYDDADRVVGFLTALND